MFLNNWMKSVVNMALWEDHDKRETIIFTNKCQVWVNANRFTQSNLQSLMSAVEFHQFFTLLSRFLTYFVSYTYSSLKSVFSRNDSILAQISQMSLIAHILWIDTMKTIWSIESLLSSSLQCLWRQISYTMPISMGWFLTLLDQYHSTQRNNTKFKCQSNLISLN